MLFGKLSILLSLSVFTSSASSQISPRELHQRARCSAGTYSSSGNTPCTACPAGSYSQESGHTSCIKARPGYYIPSNGATAEFSCQSGTYAPNEGSTRCLSCPAGYMCPSSNTHTPQQCSPGRYSTGGVADCPRCNPGTFNNIHRATSCCPCPAGWFLANGGNINCQRCPNQTPYSSPGTDSMSKCTAQPGIYAIAQSATQGSNGSCPPSQPMPSANPKHHFAPRSNCRVGQQACPIYNGARVIDYNCVDVKTDLLSCGGCVTFSANGAPSSDGGRDCSAIPFVNAVSCINAKCQIGSCERGFVLSPARDKCIPPF